MEYSTINLTWLFLEKSKMLLDDNIKQRKRRDDGDRSEWEIATICE
jgi:hypothetical protein